MQIEIVDDQTPDLDIAALVDEVAGQRIKVSRTPHNLGLAGCWNACVERATGEWVHILHQDDVVGDGFYAAYENLIEQYPEAGAVFCRSNLIDIHSQPFFQEEILQKVSGLIPDAPETLAKRNQLKCPAMVVRRAAYQAVGSFDTRFSFTLDWEMWMRLARHFPIVYCTEALASFRVQFGSETSRLAQTGENVRDAGRLIADFSKYVPESRIAELQASAVQWVSELALQQAKSFLQANLANCAMAQLQAMLGLNRSKWAMKQALMLWARAIVRTKSLIPPPLSFLPQSLFLEKQRVSGVPPIGVQACAKV